MNSDWTGMAGYALGPWLMFIATLALVLYPTGRILGRMGFSPLLAIIMLIPPFNLLALWILAFVEWPACSRSGN